MRVQKLDFSETRSFSSFFLDYIQQTDSLKPFYSRFPTPENFSDQIKEKSQAFSLTQRDILCNALHQQYKGVAISEAVKDNLALLKNPNTFTVTTGHQLNVFTGPLYFVFKIVTVINTCKVLKKRYPAYNFVPVYWMASEDHDYEEIKSLRVQGKKYTWTTQQAGAVGRFATKGLAELADEIPGDTSLFKTAYSKNKSLSAAVRHYVNELFKQEGLVVIDADDVELKKALIPVMEADILSHTPFNLVNQTNQQLHQLGYHTQVNAREINFFYLKDSLRARIEKKGDRFQVLDSKLSFSESEIKDRIKTNPEEFSPNVVLRPLYQEMILPNLTYVGGPAELVYWLELKKVFDLFKQPFPMLMPRNFGLVADAPTLRKMEKTGIELNLFFAEKNFLFNHWTLQNTTHELSTGKEVKQVTELFEKLSARANAIDSTLKEFVGAQTKRTLSALQKVEEKMIRAEKRKQKEKLAQIEAVKDAWFPNNSLQERTDNLLNFYPADPKFIDNLVTHFDPFDFRFNILVND